MTPPSALRILMTTDAVGGVFVYAGTLATALARDGHQILLVSLGPAPRRDQIKALAAVPGLRVEVTDYALEWMDPEGADADRAQDGLVRLARRFRPDLVHLNSYREACADWPAPVLVVAHSCVRSWWRACHGTEPTEPRWQSYIRNVEAGLAAATAWAAPTSAFRDTMADLYAPARAGITIHNGIDPIDPGEPKEPFILAAGRLWDSAKNIAVLGGATVPWPIKVAGSARTGDNVAALGDGLDVLGDLPRPALLTLMQRAGIFVSPALYEPFGLTVVEAAASGCALVLSDIPTFRELWDGAALFVDPRDPGAIGRALTRLCDDPVLRRAQQAAALTRAGRYGTDVMTDGYRRIYERLLTTDLRPVAPAGAAALEVSP